MACNSFCVVILAVGSLSQKDQISKSMRESTAETSPTLVLLSVEKDNKVFVKKAFNVLLAANAFYLLLLNVKKMIGFNFSHQIIANLVASYSRTNVLSTGNHCSCVILVKK